MKTKYISRTFLVNLLANYESVIIARRVLIGWNFLKSCTVGCKLTMYATIMSLNYVRRENCKWRMQGHVFN